MFESEPSSKESSSSKLWIGGLLIVAAVVIGVFIYKFSIPVGKTPAPAPARVAAAAAGPADPVHDLKILRAVMGKDRDGVTAVWSVVLENKSTAYTYSDIQYETSYIGADNKPLLVNQGTISKPLAPGDQTTSELRDALYPSGTAWYKFRVTGAKSSLP